MDGTAAAIGGVDYVKATELTPRDIEAQLGIVAVTQIEFKHLCVTVLEATDGTIVAGVYVHRNQSVAAARSRDNALTRLGKFRSLPSYRGSPPT